MCIEKKCVIERENMQNIYDFTKQIKNIRKCIYERYASLKLEERELKKWQCKREKK